MGRVADKVTKEFEDSQVDDLRKTGPMAETSDKYGLNTPARVGDTWVLLVILVLVTALGPLAMSSFIPAIPSIQQGFNVPASVAQLTFSASLWSMAAFSLVYGSLADSFGRRAVLIWGVAIAVIGSALCVFAPSVEWVIAGRALQAAGATSGFVLSRVIVRDVYGTHQAASVLGYITAAMTLAPLIGPIMGGYLIVVSGWRSVFAAFAGISILVLLLLINYLPETRSSTVSPSKPLDLKTFWTLLGLREYQRYLLFGAMAQSTFMAFLAGAPYVLSYHFKLPATAYGFYFIGVPIGFALGSFLAGRFGTRLGHQGLMYIGAPASLCACALAAWTSHGSDFSPWGLFLPAAFIAICQGISMPGAQVGILVTADEHSGAASGLFSFSVLLIGGMIAQLVGTVIQFGPQAVALVMTGTSFLACVALLLPRPSNAKSANI